MQTPPDLRDRLLELARQAARLPAPSHRDPEAFHVARSELAGQLRDLAVGCAPSQPPQSRCGQFEHVGARPAARVAARMAADLSPAYSPPRPPPAPAVACTCGARARPGIDLSGPIPRRRRAAADERQHKLL